MTAQLSRTLTPMSWYLFMTKACILTPLQSYCQIVTSTPQQTAASSMPIYTITFITQLQTMTLMSLHGRSTMEPNKSRMIHETMRLFVPALHGLTVTLFGKHSRLQPFLPGSLWTRYCANILKLWTLLWMSHRMMNPWLLTPSSWTPLL